jgi:YD repeat-containing protein
MTEQDGPAAGAPGALDLATRVAEGATGTGVLLRGRYELLEVLGEGGQGRVVRAWDHHHNRAVALKVQPVVPGADRELVLAESRMLLSLRPHENIPTARDDFFEGDDHYLVMDWVSGEDLRAVLRRDGNPGLPYAAALQAMKDVAAALDHLHSHEPPVVHGDVKPANIVVSGGSGGERLRAVLVDFGLAGRLSGAGSPGATEAYASPEVYSGGPATPAADVYSFAATAFELITGRVPIPGATLDWSSVPHEALDAVRHGLARGLAFEPNHRPRSAGELVASIAPTASRAPRRRGRRSNPLAMLDSRPTRRARLQAVIGMVVAAAIAAAVTFAVTDDPAPVVVAAEDPPVNGPELFPPEDLPAGSQKVSRIGVFDPKADTDGTQGALFETFDLGADGAVALRGGQIGMTQTWTSITQLTADKVLFYRDVDQYTIVVNWTADGSVLDEFTPVDFGGGWTHLTRVGPGLLVAYDTTQGRAQVVTYDDLGHLTGQVPATGLRAGWTQLVAAADGRLLAYDASTGAATGVGVAADGSMVPEGEFNHGPGWVTATQVTPGIVVLGDGSVGRLRVFDFRSPGTFLTLDEEVATFFDVASSPADGYLLVYRTADGVGELLHMQVTQIVEGPEVHLPKGGTRLVARP